MLNVMEIRPTGMLHRYMCCNNACYDALFLNKPYLFKKGINNIQKTNMNSETIANIIGKASFIITQRYFFSARGITRIDKLPDPGSNDTTSATRYLWETWECFALLHVHANIFLFVA